MKETNSIVDSIIVAPYLDELEVLKKYVAPIEFAIRFNLFFKHLIHENGILKCNILDFSTTNEFTFIDNEKLGILFIAKEFNGVSLYFYSLSNKIMNWTFKFTDAYTAGLFLVKFYKFYLKYIFNCLNNSQDLLYLNKLSEAFANEFNFELSKNHLNFTFNYID